MKICEAGDEGMHFNQSAHEMIEVASRMTIDKALDTLLDNGVITGNWEQREVYSRDGKREVRVRVFKVSGEYNQILKKIFEQTRARI